MPRPKPLGHVFLVGAGPGRPDLLTLRGAELLGRADAVVLDALVDRRVLAHCREGVAVIDAGKRGHGRVLMRQPEINRLLVRLARGGKTVVRLKGGDPYIFGRGGEEAECLAEAGIPFEVVPGVSSVGAAPAFAGIPLTHRGLASTVTVVTGHGGAGNPYLRETGRARREPPRVDWTRVPRDGTLVVLMGLARLAEITAELARAGWPADTPVAVVSAGGWATQRSVRGVLGDIAGRVRRARLSPPALIVCGRVVALAPRLNWFERRPLHGRTVLVTRALDQAGSLSRRLEERGARVIESPAIAIRPLASARRLDEYWGKLSTYDGVIFTSANAVRSLSPRLDGRAWPSAVPVFAVGPKTADALLVAGIPVRAVAPVFSAEGVAKILGRNLQGRRFLFPRAVEGRDMLVRHLGEAGAHVDLWPVYQTRALRPAPEIRKLLLTGGVDAITFTSSSTVRALLGAFPPAARRRIFPKTLAASIGPLTSRTLREFGVPPAVEADGATVEALADALARRFAPPA